VEIKISDYASIEPALLDGSYDMSLLSRNHLTDIADPIGFLEADYTCKGGYNISHFCDPQMDERIAQANAAEDPEERYSIYADVAQELQEQAVTVFLVNEQTTAASRNNVQNFVDDPLVRYAVTPDLAVE
jgi:peptide/nickel transport system substrate-binding protein